MLINKFSLRLRKAQRKPEFYNLKCSCFRLSYNSCAITLLNFTEKNAFVIVVLLQDPLAQAALLDLSLKEEEVEQWVTCLAAKFNASAR